VPVPDHVPGPLRVIDFGRVAPLRSQTLWHAVATGVSQGAPPTLSFARPDSPYVCLGYHRALDEVDGEYCRVRGLPVYRRMVGGGPVYLDDGQLFFQICLPAAAVSPARAKALRTLLAPAVEAFRAAGVDARLDEQTEICAGEAKICGHGAGQIEGAVVLCGNLIERFDHERATAVLGLRDAEHRAQTLALMRRYVAATPANPAAFAEALAGAYAGALGLAAVPGELTAAEVTAVGQLDELFTSQAWLRGPARPAGGLVAGAGTPAAVPVPRPARQVKVRAGVWTFAADGEAGARAVASVVRGMIERAWLSAPGLNGGAERARHAVTGIPLREAPGVLARFGEPGRRLAAAFAAADGTRL
jgi:lipoate-protein ligase A